MCIRDRFKALFTKHPYSMYELKICRDYRDGKVTKEELDKCSTCDMCAVVNNEMCIRDSLHLVQIVVPPSF